VALEISDLDAMGGDAEGTRRFVWPGDWPDEAGRTNLDWFRQRIERSGLTRWGPRAMVDASGAMVGHIGFHAPPTSIHGLLDADPTFEGDRGTPGSAVELGYTVLPGSRRQGFATEAATALVEWALASGAVDAVIATVAVDNKPSLAVLDRVGGFIEVGRCSDDGTEERVFRRDAG
jgi:RimJ/RimL family protein N-acetyltransferase